MRTGRGWTGLYGARLKATEVVLWLGMVALGAAELLLAAAVWVIVTVAPLARALAERVVDLVSMTGPVMDDGGPVGPRGPGGQNEGQGEPHAAGGAAHRPARAPMVIDGEVLHVNFDDGERVA